MLKQLCISHNVETATIKSHLTAHAKNHYLNNNEQFVFYKYLTNQCKNGSLISDVINEIKFYTMKLEMTG